jgi:hypothetical protein
MSAMDLDLPLEDVIKKSKNKGKVTKKPTVNKGRPQSKQAFPVAKPSTQRGGKIGKSYTSGTAQGRGVAKKNGPPPKARAGLFSAAASKRGGISTVCTACSPTPTPSLVELITEFFPFSYRLRSVVIYTNLNLSPGTNK